MNRYLSSSIIFVLTVALTFFSCGGPNEASSSKEAATPVVSIVTKDVNLSKDSSNSDMDEPAPSPIIIRSAVPPGSYFYKPDTLQVSQYIRRIFQDTKGDLWFGTVGDGVCRYDGRYLTYYTTREGFGGNNVQGIAEDKDGNIWFATTGGVSKYDASGEGSPFTNFTVKEGLSDNSILSIFIDKSDNIWVGTGKGVCRYNARMNNKTGQGGFTAFPIPESAEKLEVKSIIEDRAGNIWLASNGGGVYRYSAASGALTNISKKDGLCDNVVNCILQDKTGNIWFATKNGLSRYDPLTELRTGSRNLTNYTTKEGLSGDQVLTMIEDKTGTMWFAARGGICRYNPSSATSAGNGLFTIFGVKEGLTNVGVQSLCEDRAGNFWIGTGAGLFRFDRSRANHPCTINTCGHDLKIPKDLNEHKKEQAKTFINVTKKGPWPKQFR